MVPLGVTARAPFAIPLTITLPGGAVPLDTTHMLSQSDILVVVPALMRVADAGGVYTMSYSSVTMKLTLGLVTHHSILLSQIEPLLHGFPWAFNH